MTAKPSEELVFSVSETTATPLDAVEIAQLNFLERQHLQEWVLQGSAPGLVDGLTGHAARSARLNDDGSQVDVSSSGVVPGGPPAALPARPSRALLLRLGRSDPVGARCGSTAR